MPLSVHHHPETRIVKWLAEYAHDRCYELQRDLERQVHELREAGRWISVSEGLPRGGLQQVLATDGQMVMIAYCWNRSGFANKSVTHWRPLPVPPTAEGTEG
jgi:Protein of unknown function (DUF551)